MDDVDDFIKCVQCVHADLMFDEAPCNGCYQYSNFVSALGCPEEKAVSDGGSSSYYKLPPEASDLQDLIEAKDMSFARANIFKACYRMGEKAGADALYDINKIIWFAERMKLMIEKGNRL